MIGIDIIDHSFSFQNSKYGLEQYKSRILNMGEYPFCNTWNDLDLIWAIKESTYKCHFKKTGEEFFNSKRITITSIDYFNRQFSAAIDEIFYTGGFEQNPDYVFAICGDLDGVKVFMARQTDKPNTKAEMAHYLGLGEDSKFVFNKKGFAEFIEHNGNIHPYSRSHHGQFYISAITSPRDN